MREAEVRARAARLRSDWENAKRDHTQQNATQAGVELLVTFFEDIFKEEEEAKGQLQEGTGTPPGGSSEAGQQPPPGGAGTVAGSH